MNKRSFTSKLFSIVMSVALIIGSCGFSIDVFAESKTSKPSNEVAQFNDFSVLENTIKLRGISSVKYYYSDGFFTQSATVENVHMYNTSIIAAESASGTNPSKVLGLLSTLGYSNGVANADFYTTPTENTIGVVSAYKKITDGNNEFYVVPVIVRGGGYESEWAGNGVLGDSSNLNHKNFQASADKAVALATQVISDNKLPADKVKIWITGYSRGAAVANLAAKTLSDTYGKEDVYAYTFEAARCTTASQSVREQYTNIRNVIYEDDLVTYIPPSAYGFSWYGQVITLSNSTSNMTSVNEQLQILVPGSKCIENDAKFNEYAVNVDLNDVSGLISQAIAGTLDLNPKRTSRSVSQSVFLAETFDTIINTWKLFGTRTEYATKTYEKGMTSGYDTAEYAVKTLLDCAFNGDLDPLEEIVQDMGDIITSDSFTDLVRYGLKLKTMLTEGTDAVDWDPYIGLGRKDVYDYMWSAFDKAYTNYKTAHGGQAPFSDEQYAALKNCRYALFKMALNMAYYDLKGDNSATVIGTLVECGEIMTEDHYPEKIMAFLMVKDNYYVSCTHSLKKTSGTAATAEKTGTYDTWTCSKCGLMYKDANGYNEITEDKKVVAKIDSSSITLSQDRYDESVAVENRKPTVTVKDTNGKELVAETDYTVAYANYDKAGKATATITFKGNYSGTATKYYRIGNALYVSGTLKGYEGTGNVKLTIYKGNDIYATETYSASDSSYKLMTLHEGTCYLKVEATGYVTRTYELNVTDDTTQNVEIRQLGDVNLSGTLSAADVTAMARHLAKIETFKDPYQILLMDVDKDSVYDAKDVTKLARYIARIISSL